MSDSAVLRLKEEQPDLEKLQLIEDACASLEKAGYEVITEDESGESILPRPRRPKN